jgi:hypothetical protein
MEIDSTTALKQRADVALVLDKDKRQILKDSITKRQGNIKEFAKQNSIIYDTLNRWITLSNYRKREPPISFVFDTCNKHELNQILNKEKISLRIGRCFQTVPRKIRLNELFYEAYGLYLGEGCEKANKITFTNTDVNLLRLVIEWIQSIDSEIKIKAYIYVPQKSNMNINKANNIIKELGFAKENIGGFYINKKSAKVCLLLHINNAALKYVLDESKSKIHDYMLSDSGSTKAFLRGYLAAEGSIYLSKKPNEHYLDIGFGKEKEFILIKNCFDKLGIPFKTSIYKNKYPRLRIYTKENLKKIKEFGGFGKNIERQKKLLIACS